MSRRQTHDTQSTLRRPRGPPGTLGRRRRAVRDWLGKPPPGPSVPEGSKRQSRRVQAQTCWKQARQEPEECASGRARPEDCRDGGRSPPPSASANSPGQEAHRRPGCITGHGFDYIIIDDPQKASLAHSETERRNLEELYASAIANRWRDPPKGVLILVMQRLHVDDFTAFLLRACPNAVHLNIPAIRPSDMVFQISDEEERHVPEGSLLEPDRLSHEVLQELRVLQGEVHFQAQYMQAPLVTHGRVIDPTWFRTFAQVPKREYRILSIDPAFTENGG